MLNQERLKETLDTANFECWGCERTATPVRVFAVHLHATGCSLREIQEILRLFGVERSHQAIWHRIRKIYDSFPDPLEVKPKRVAVDETAVKINGKLCWLYTAIYLTQSLFLTPNRSNDMVLIRRLYPFIALPRNTISPILCFSSTVSNIRLLSLD